ncbi:MAG: DUF1566 domain-containing protein [Treponema sp.]|nr:DUF1566 domain-containing protein [Treponema sp.]
MKTKFILKAIVLIFILMFTACTKNSETKTYKIGDTGPAGGIVFYDKGNTDGGWRYLEAAPASSEFFAEWGLAFFSLETEMDIGTGKRNTTLIVAALNKIRETAGRAAMLTDDMNINGFDDWFLPSWDELNLMYINLHKQGLGGFKNADYWSSSSFSYGGDAVGAYNMFFDGDDTGDGGSGFARYQNCRVRAVRSFGGSGEPLNIDLSFLEGGTPEQTSQIAYNVTFNDQIIPMTVFYYTNDEGGYYFTEKITFDYNDNNHTLDIPENWYPYNSIGEDSTYNIAVDDFNFDGYMDIAIYNGSGTTTFWYNYFIYDTKGKRYEYNEELSGLPNIFINEERQILKLHTNDGHAGLMYTSSDYKWINGKLTLMRKDKQDYDSDRDIYILTSGVLNNNGVWEEKKQQFTEAQLLEEF